MGEQKILFLGLLQYHCDCKTVLSESPWEAKLGYSEGSTLSQCHGKDSSLKDRRMLTVADGELATIKHKSTTGNRKQQTFKRKPHNTLPAALSFRTDVGISL